MDYKEPVPGQPPTSTEGEKMPRVKTERRMLGDRSIRHEEIGWPGAESRWRVENPYPVPRAGDKKAARALGHQVGRQLSRPSGR